jgi:hypothetical protein
MSIDGWITAANFVIAFGMIGTGLVFFWQAWKRNALLEWPPSILVLLGIVPFLIGLAWGQILVFRLAGLDVGGPFGINGVGTMIFRWIVAGSVAVRMVRVARGTLLTTADRNRLNGGGG